MSEAHRHPLPLGEGIQGTIGTRRLGDLTAPAPSGEMAALAELRRAGVPLADGWVVEGSHAEARKALAEAARLLLQRGGAVRIRALAAGEVARRRLGRRIGLGLEARDEVSLQHALYRLEEALRDEEGAQGLVAVLYDPGEAGVASSIEPSQGDPDIVTVEHEGETRSMAWRFDRRSMRPVQQGERLPAELAEMLADAADRAQLTLGRPVRLAWVRWEGRVGVYGVGACSPEPRFGDGRWRRVTLVSADDEPVAPLTVDLLDRALSPSGTPAEPWVRRIYARPYRRLPDPLLGATVPDPLAAPHRPLATLRNVTGVTTETMAPLLWARRYFRTVREACIRFDEEVLGTLETSLLLHALRRRAALVVEGFERLDRARTASAGALKALQGIVGALPESTLRALAAPRLGPRRRLLWRRMRRMALHLARGRDHLPTLEELAPEDRRRLQALRMKARRLRPIGLDVRPLPYGHDEKTFLMALEVFLRRDPARIEQRRAAAVRRVLARARAQRLAALRESSARTLLAVAERVARAKGIVAEATAASLLRLRAATVEAGRRLHEEAILDVSEDALYLHLQEIEEGLRGEPGAYAARVRLRREEDLRWRRFFPPRWIEPRP